MIVRNADKVKRRDPILVAAATVLALIGASTVAFANFVYGIGVPLYLIGIDDVTRFAFSFSIAVAYSAALANFTFFLIHTLYAADQMSNADRTAERSRRSAGRELPSDAAVSRKRRILDLKIGRMYSSGPVIAARYGLAAAMFLFTFGTINMFTLPALLVVLVIFPGKLLIRHHYVSQSRKINNSKQIHQPASRSLPLGIRASEVAALVAVLSLIAGEMRAHRLLTEQPSLITAGDQELCGRVLISTNEGILLATSNDKSRLFILSENLEKISLNDSRCSD